MPRAVRAALHWGRETRMTASLDEALARHCQALAGCRRCAQVEGVRPIVAMARCPRVMLVGQAPGWIEAGGGRPFAGRAGKTLFRWLEQAGITEEAARDRIYISAVTRCYPGPSSSGRGDRVPPLAERTRCAAWLDDELRIIRPALIIPVGKLAITRFLGGAPLERLIGREHLVEDAGGSAIAVPLPHPSGASSWVHQADHARLLALAVARIAEHLQRLGLIGVPYSRSVA